MASGQPLLDVRNLALSLRGTQRRLVSDVSFSVAPGEIVGIVGESGSGKTLVSRAIIGLEPPAVHRTAGAIRFEGIELTALRPRELRKVRGARIGMVLQDPMTALNPSMTIGRQLEEGLILHGGQAAPERRKLILDMLSRVGIAEPAAALEAYPHQFSGGMRQRMVLASTMLLNPALMIADEPTTALDALVQRDVLELIVELTGAHRTAVLLISHDLPMIARYTSRIIVMQNGSIVEQGETDAILSRPQHPYTARLLAATPHRSPRSFVPGRAVPIVEVQNLVVDYGGRSALLRTAEPKRALHGVSLAVPAGAVVAVVGESGSGKTTLGRAIAGLVPPSGGRILFEGKPVPGDRADYRTYRANCQMIFQDPYSSLDPRMTVGQIIGEALRAAPELDGREKRRKVMEILGEVGLGEGFAGRYPHELSGGQRQRVAIARAVVGQPSFVVADEPVSALDVTARAQILELFAEMQKRRGFSCLFISHDLGVVEQVADRVVVMRKGEIVEENDRDGLFDDPRHAYTRALLAAIPKLEAREDGGVRLAWRYERERFQGDREGLSLPH